MIETISLRGMEAVVPLLKGIVYERSDAEKLLEEESLEMGMSMTVPIKSMFEEGSMCSTRVPGG